MKSSGTSSTVAVAAQRSRLPAYSLTIKTGHEHVEALSTALAAFGKAIRAAIQQSNDLGDLVTADLFTGMSGEVDKQRWFVEAHRQAER